MKVAPLPANEQARIAALHSYRILDTPYEPVFDAITHLAATICNVPIAIISLIDKDRQWFKSVLGLPGASETPRDLAFCAHAILREELMEVPDATADDRFHDNIFVTEDPRVRFYAGMPLVDDEGLALGTLCVIDRQPRHLDGHQRTMLSELSLTVMKLLEARRMEADLRRAKDELAHIEHMASLGRVIAGVAHEVNTPVGNIRLSISCLQQTVDGLMTAFTNGNLRKSDLQDFFTDFTDAAAVISQGSERAAALMDHLKDLHLDSHEVVRKPFAIAPVIDRILQPLAGDLRARHIDIHLDIDPAIRLFGDPGQFQQIISTLISNSLVHGFDGRHDGHIQIDAAVSDASCHIRFADDGNGIAPEHLGRVFEPYYTTHFGQGRSGLGLYLVHNLISAAFQGEVSIDSHLGAGTELTMSFPLAPGSRRWPTIPAERALH